MPAVKSSYAVFFKPSFLFLFPACTVVTVQEKARSAERIGKPKGRKEEMQFMRMELSRACLSLLSWLSPLSVSKVLEKAAMFALSQGSEQGGFHHMESSGHTHW